MDQLNLGTVEDLVTKGILEPVSRGSKTFLTEATALGMTLGEWPDTLIVSRFGKETVLKHHSVHKVSDSPVSVEYQSTDTLLNFIVYND